MHFFPVPIGPGYFAQAHLVPGRAAPDRSWLSRVGSPHTHVSHKAVSSPRPGDASAIRGYGAEQLHNEPLERREGLTAGVGAAVATFGLTVFMPRAAKSLPLADIEAGAVKPQDIVEEASVTVHVHPASSPSPLALLVAQGTSRVWLALAGHTKNGRYWHKVDQLDALLRPLLTQSRLFVRCWSLRDFVFE